MKPKHLLFSFLFSCLALCFTVVNSHAQCAAGETEIIVTLNSDSFGAETSWTLTDNIPAPNVLASAALGSVPSSTTTVTSVCTDCDQNPAAFTFEINDSFGDGICCTFGLGSYTVTENGNTVIESNAGNMPFTGSSKVDSFGTACAPLIFAPVPTMSEWGLLLLVLLTLTFGAVFMTARRGQLAGSAGNISFGSAFRNMPFNAMVYGRFLIGTFVVVALVFAIAITALGYSLTNADIPGALICTPVLAYLVYLLFGKRD